VSGRANSCQPARRELALSNVRGKNFRANVAKGGDAGEMALNMCMKIFDPSLAAGLNWVETDIKRGIKKMKCGDIIVGKYSLMIIMIVINQNVKIFKKMALNSNIRTA